MVEPVIRSRQRVRTLLECQAAHLSLSVARHNHGQSDKVEKSKYDLADQNILAMTSQCVKNAVDIDVQAGIH